MQKKKLGQREESSLQVLPNPPTPFVRARFAMFFAAGPCSMLVYVSDCMLMRLGHLLLRNTARDQQRN